MTVKKDSEITAVLMPDGSIQLEWAPPVSADLPQRSYEIQQNILARSIEEPDGWLFFLGFCSLSISLSPSLTFWRSFSRLFIRKLKLTPELEQLRANVVIPLAEEERSRFLETAPLMPGSEYLTAEILRALWEGFHETFYRTSISPAASTFIWSKTKIMNLRSPFSPPTPPG